MFMLPDPSSNVTQWHAGADQDKLHRVVLLYAIALQKFRLWRANVD